MSEGRGSLLTRLFFVFFKIGAFTFGGGYAMLPLIERELVDARGWLEEEEFFDVIAISQSVPGPIAVNAAVFTGKRVGGWLGAIVAGVGVMLPSFAVMLVVAMFFATLASNEVASAVFRGVRPVVVALILHAALKLGKAITPNRLNCSIGIVSGVLLLVFGLHPIIAIVGTALVGVLQVVMTNNE